MAACPIPIISGVGHETDFTLSDFAADLRAPTPTAAAELATAAQEETMQQIVQQSLQLQKQLRYQLEHYTHRLDRASLALQNPAMALQAQQQKLNQLSMQLRHSLQQTLAQKQHALQALETRLPTLLESASQKNSSAFMQLQQRWQHQVPALLTQYQQQLQQLHTRLHAINPARILSRGYAWINDEQGHVISSASQLHAGQTIQAQFADGKAQAKVIQSTPELLPPQD
jgi:Exonuclease VII, large subunit